MAPTVLKLMSTPTSVLPESITYFQIYFAGSIGFVMYNTLVGILQAAGDSKHPLYYLIFSGSATHQRTPFRRRSSSICHRHITAVQRHPMPDSSDECRCGLPYRPIQTTNQQAHDGNDTALRPAIRTSKLHYGFFQRRDSVLYQFFWKICHGWNRRLYQGGRIYLHPNYKFCNGHYYLRKSESGSERVRESEEGNPLWSTLHLTIRRNPWCAFEFLCRTTGCAI